MATALDMLGSLLQGGISNSTPGRIQNSLSEKGVGGTGGILDQILGGLRSSTTSPPTQAGAGPSGLRDLLGSVFGGGSGLKAGGLGALAGAILGGGAKGAVGGGALALLGSMALQAMRNAGAMRADATQLDSATRLAAGLQSPANKQEQAEVESVADLIVHAMTNAAKADGQIDEREVERIASTVCKDGANAAERDEFMNELRKPLDTDALVRAVPNQQVAAQVYAASLLAIDLDSEAERRYLADLARGLKLNDGVVRQLHAVTGAA